MSLDIKSLEILNTCIKNLDDGFRDMPEFEQITDKERMKEVLTESVLRMHDNFPYQHPLYAGQMLKPPHPVARLAYSMSMFINPNNHALDGGRASSAMEKEAVAEIAGMFGWSEFLGHLCGGGTMANLEALWVAGRLKPGEKVVASAQAHYTHSRISDVLQLGFESVPCDSRAKMDIDFLKKMLKNNNIGTVVATIGTTGFGSVDPLPDILDLKKKYKFRIHVDSAYGGYYKLAGNLSKDAAEAYNCLNRVDSIVIDPHKHGLQPYGCGCVLFRDPAVGSIYKHDSPYTYFSSDELHLGEISLECSRPGASAAALWATQKFMPLVKMGEFAGNLEKCRKAALSLYDILKNDPRYLTLFAPELDIIVWAPEEKNSSEISKLSKMYFKEAAEKNLHLALIELPVELAGPYWKNVNFDSKTVTCLRSCLMKPEHLEWKDRIWEILDKIACQNQ